MPRDLKNLLVAVLLLAVTTAISSALIVSDKGDPVIATSALFLALALFLPADWPGEDFDA